MSECQRGKIGVIIHFGGLVPRPSMLTRGYFANYEASLCFVHPGFMKMAQHLEESRPRRNQGQLDPFSTQQR